MALQGLAGSSILRDTFLNSIFYNDLEIIGVALASIGIISAL